MKTALGAGYRNQAFFRGSWSRKPRTGEKKGRIFNTSLQGGYKIVESFPQSIFLHLFFDDHEM